MRELNFNLGVVELPVNGGRVVRFNPSDAGFLDTLFALMGKIESISKDTEKKLAKTDDLAKRFDYGRAGEKRRREAVDSVFGEGFCDDVFQGIWMTSMADGMMALENFIFAIVDEMNEDIKDNLAKRNDRIAKYTAKYKSRKNNTHNVVPLE